MTYLSLFLRLTKVSNWNNILLAGNMWVDDLLADSVIVCVLLYTGVMPQYNYDYTVVALYAFQVQIFYYTEWCMPRECFSNFHYAGYVHRRHDQSSGVSHQDGRRHCATITIQGGHN
jgi:hypothetical protein